jgi:hypothetical protein
MRNQTPKIMCCMLVLMFTATISKGASEEKKENPYLWKSKVTSVTVFKNGLGFFLREGQTNLRDGWCISGAIPPASFGTLAIYPHEEDRTVDIVGSGPGDIVEFNGVDIPDDIETKRGRLESCMYLKIELSYMDNKRENTAAGKLVSVGNQYVILESENSNFAVPLEGVTKLLVLENPLRIHVASDDNTAVKNTKLGMAYLRKGITWIPDYTLKLLNDNTAELTLRGTLVNEAEDLIHCDVQFVVGVPHFVHTDYLAPISVGQVIRTIGASVAPVQISNQMLNRSTIAGDNSIRSNQFTTSNRTITDSSERDLQNALGNLPRVETAGASDFTIYERKDLTMRVGEKAIVTLFTKTIKYRHGYRWEPPNEIEHFLILENNTDSSFTTGPCLVISDNRALSEDLLKYIPQGGSGEIPVTTAINIAKDQKETETDRQRKEYEASRNYFLDLVSLSGELKLRNFDQKEIEIIVKTRINGKPLTASDNGDIVLNSENLELLKQTGTISWVIKLQPGETKTLTYKYERYVPSVSTN